MLTSTKSFSYTEPYYYWRAYNNPTEKNIINAYGFKKLGSPASPIQRQELDLAEKLLNNKQDKNLALLNLKHPDPFIAYICKRIITGND